MQWIAALTAPPAPGGRAQSLPRITTDPVTGERSLQLPMPDPATVRRLADGLSGLLARLQR